MMLNIDTRTATEYGLVRTFGAAKFQFTTQGAGTVNPNSFNTSLPVAGTTGLLTSRAKAMSPSRISSCSSRDSPSASRRPPMQTPGRARPATSRRSCWAVTRTTTPANNIQYTAQFGNGVSATIGLDDPVVWDRTAVYNLVAAAECDA